MPRGRRLPPDAEVAERPAASTVASSRRAGPVGARRGRPAYVVVGIGLNVGWAPDGAARLGDGIDPADVLDALLVALRPSAGRRRRVVPSVTGDPRPTVACRAPRDQTVTGRAFDVMPDGRLVVLDECGITHRFDTGDVVHSEVGARKQRGPQLPSVCARPRRDAAVASPRSTSQPVGDGGAGRRRRRHGHADRGAQDRRLGRTCPRCRPSTSATANGSVENYLLVGSDSRAGADPTHPTPAASAPPGCRHRAAQRHDHDPARRQVQRRGVAAVAAPRPVGPRSPGTDSKRRINSAFNDGPDVLVQTLQQDDFGIPIHHYVEVDFSGFK